MDEPTAINVQQERLRDRFRGTLVGLAVGDALGAPLEFQPARTPEHYVTDLIGGGWQRLAPGEWTDEDIGLHTGRVLDAISRGESWEQASRDVQELDPDNAPNGSLMRCAPLALFFYRHPDFAAQLSPVLSRITHGHPDCEWACVFINVLITHLLAGKNASDSVEATYEACDNASPELKARIGYAMMPKCETSPTGWVLDTLEVALWSFLHTSSFEAALLVAVNRGADADTVGAVTGAIAGARYGMSGIPSRWLTQVKESAFLIHYADRLLELAQSST
jgi:ADP-ribosyl-[dinitrogen reductase] hydrolase